MNDVRDDLADDAWAALDRLAPDLEFRVMRRNLIQRFILDPCLARPERLAPNRHYFGDAYEDLRRALAGLHAGGAARRYIDVRPLAETLLDRHQPAILDALSRMAGESCPARGNGM